MKSPSSIPIGGLLVMLWYSQAPNKQTSESHEHKTLATDNCLFMPSPCLLRLFTRHCSGILLYSLFFALVAHLFYGIYAFLWYLNLWLSWLYGLGQNFRVVRTRLLSSLDQAVRMYFCLYTMVHIYTSVCVIVCVVIWLAGGLVRRCVDWRSRAWVGGWVRAFFDLQSVSEK